MIKSTEILLRTGAVVQFKVFRRKGLQSTIFRLQRTYYTLTLPEGVKKLNFSPASSRVKTGVQ
jgi:hypothetical protein